MQKKAHIWSEGPESGGGWSQVRIKEDEETLKKRRRVNSADSSVVYSPRGHYSPYMVTQVPSLFLSLPLPFSLTHSPSPSLSFPLFCNIPSLNVQPVCPSRLSEYATSRLDTLHGRRDQNGPRGDPELKRLPKQINTPRDVHQKAGGKRQARMRRIAVLRGFR